MECSYNNVSTIEIKNIKNNIYEDHNIINIKNKSIYNIKEYILKRNEFNPNKNIIYNNFIDKIELRLKLYYDVVI